MRRGKHGGVDISYRNLRKEDIPQLEKLQIALFPVKYAPIFYQKLLQDGYYCIVAVCDDAIVGVASARICAEENVQWWNCFSSSPGYIMTIGVDDTYRGHGIGSVLLEEGRYIYLHVKEGNEAAIQFYRKNGFTVERHVQNYYFIEGINYNSFRFGRKKNTTPIAYHHSPSHIWSSPFSFLPSSSPFSSPFSSSSSSSPVPSSSTSTSTSSSSSSSSPSLWSSSSSWWKWVCGRNVDDDSSLLKKLDNT